MAKRDYYEVLGVNRDADEESIKKAYRRLAMSITRIVTLTTPSRRAVQGGQRGVRSPDRRRQALGL